MKKTFVSTIILVIMLVITCANVKADEVQHDNCYQNKKGVCITENDLNKLKAYFHTSVIDELNQNEVEKFLNSTIVDTQTKYFKSVYQGEKVIDNTEISKEEYDNAPSTTSKCDMNTRSSDVGYFETSYKSLTSSIFQYNNSYSFMTTLLWKIVPVTRSYDVIAFRTRHLSYSNVAGAQTYYVGNNSTLINYNTNSAGYKGLSNGAGISMNLKDDSNITSFVMTIVADMQISEYNYSTAHVFTTYQHATSSLTRDQSKSYTLQAGGLGDVLYYSNTNIRNKYDDMTGIELMIPIP